MIPRNAEPVSHQSVYKRISIGSDAGRPKSKTEVIRTPCEEAAHHVKMQEVNRIWKLVVQTAHGTTASSPVEQAVSTVDGIDPYYLPENVSLEDLELISFAKTGGPT